MKKSEIIAAIIGALLSGVISLSFGIWNINTTYQMQINKELRYAIKRDINTLRRVEKEFDHNLNILLNNRLEIDVTFKEATEVINKIKNDSIKDLYSLMNSFIGKSFIVTKYVVPRERLIVGSWNTYLIMYNDEIDFDLADSLSIFYRKMERINTQINHIESIISMSSRLVPLKSKNQVDRLQKQAIADISEISKKDILKLKKEVGKEIERLQVKLAKVEE